jgi:hypothetical protein
MLEVRRCGMWKYYVAGVVPSLALSVIGLSFGLLFFPVFFLPGGLLAGFIGHMVAKKKSMSPPQTIRDVRLSFALGILLLPLTYFLILNVLIIGS